ncbi:MAG: aminopeptidase N [Thiomicrospira sp.]|uniref:aminopeptidase N n=1 Tax=Thiomicrospira sp. TaxID=935 RepID=UPI0019DB801E|nr:aminopeptidase N [Thiomicrospira sp.]MBE0494537.1 aminopeptidase N [Thiomicrospira sp.]
MVTDVSVNYLKDYQPTEFSIEAVDLTFELLPKATLVTNRLSIKKAHPQAKQLKLNGENLELVSVSIDGQVLSKLNYQLNDQFLTLDIDAPVCVIEIVTRVSPESNTALEGLYRSGGNYCTQCEAEGFRKITYFLDRPDVLSVYSTTIIADKVNNPVLLSNGNLIEFGDLSDGRHFAKWQDPFKKPCYLFALVAGDLAYMEDHFKAQDGRDICLRIYTDAAHLSKCRHAMDSLIHSMRWDEERFGRVYDLDIYMIVAVDDFNMGAMENKGLNVFNSKFVLADPQTATDTDFEGVEAVIAHEYFHNWTGNRITCRDWFQLTLKEGLTVFRDQEFTADRLSSAVKRIEDVRRLRSVQFPEDAGPTSHPIQPQSYIEMNNFYTMTVYEKGAEVVRLYQTLLGRDGFRKGMDLYFERYDGQAVTVQDFRQAMADANQVDLAQMHQWYVQPGTPILKVDTHYDAANKCYQIHCQQSTPGLVDAHPLLIPIKIGLLSPTGEALTLYPAKACADTIRIEADSAILQLTQSQQTFEFVEVEKAPIPSLLREFSAPVSLQYGYSLVELEFLAQHDTDSFNRWEAAQRLAVADLMHNVTRLQAGKNYQLGESYSRVFLRLLNEVNAGLVQDLALQAYALSLPDMSYLIEQYEQVDIDALLTAHQQMKQALGLLYYSELELSYQALNETKPYAYNKQDIAQRLMKNRCLQYLVASESTQAIALAVAQYQNQANMTDVLVALEALSHVESEQAETCMDDFYNRWQDEALVLDKWFALKASANRSDALKQVKDLLSHAKFSYRTPNRVRSVVGVFARQNLKAFHQTTGQGYEWLADQVLHLDKLNPQVAARILTPLTHWSRYDDRRQALMLAQLNRISQQANSKDVYELVEKSLLVAG